MNDSRYVNVMTLWKGEHLTLNGCWTTVTGKYFIEKSVQFTKKWKRESFFCRVTNIIKYQVLITKGSTVCTVWTCKCTYIIEWLREKESNRNWSHSRSSFLFSVISAMGKPGGDLKPLTVQTLSHVFYVVVYCWGGKGNGLKVRVSESAALIGNW